MSMGEVFEEGDSTHYDVEDIESEVAKCTGELEYHLDSVLQMEIIGDLVQTPDDYFEKYFGDYISRSRTDPEAGAYDFIDKYRPNPPPTSQEYATKTLRKFKKWQRKQPRCTGGRRIRMGCGYYFESF